MYIPRTKQTLKLLEENPDGLSIEDLEEMLGCKRRSVFDVLKILKKTNPIEKNDRGRYILKPMSNKIDSPIPKDSSKWITTKLDKIVEAIHNSPNGLTRDELSKMFDITVSAVANRIFNLRKKGYDIKNVMGRYEVPPASVMVTKSASLPKDIPAEKNLKIPTGYQKAYKNLSDSDKIDFTDMLRKSIYYQKSAMALLESNIEVESLLSSMEVHNA